MRKIILAILLATFAVLPALASAAERAPLLMAGKKTLYQRVLSRPGAVLKRAAGDGPGSRPAALTRYYVYSRKTDGGADWIEVGLTDKGRVDGWLREDQTIPWKQQLALAFTNPAGRDRALFFRDRKDLTDLLAKEHPEQVAAPLVKAIAAGKSDPRVVSIEPANVVDIAKHFYLLPILGSEETFTAAGNRVRVLEVASVSARDGAGPKPSGPAPLRDFKAALVFVIDSTVSMGPYIDRTREAVRRIYDQIDKAGLSDRMKFGLVAFRSSTKATPGLEYTARLYADPAQVKDGKDFLRRIEGLQEAHVSSARFSEDSLAGVMTALDKVSWPEFGGRYVVLVTDAGALRGSDPLSSTHLDPEQVRLEAQHRGVAIYALHLLTREGQANHAEAEAQYKTLSTHPLLPQPLYYGVDTGSVEGFGKIVDLLGNSIAKQVEGAFRGENVAGSARSADAAPGQPKDDAARLRAETELLGHAMQLAYLGRKEGTAAPSLFNAWISDRDLARPEIATTDVRVLLSKNQLSDMQQVLAGIVKVGQAAQLSPADFFARLRSAAAVLGRDPNAINKPNATRLADLGLMGEYLDDLPYHSKVLDVDQQTWSSWSIGQQQSFLDEIERKLRLYQRYHDDVDRWIALDDGADPGEAVYPVPLDALP